MSSPHYLLFVGDGRTAPLVESCLRDYVALAHAGDEVRLEIVPVREVPERAEHHRVLATPTIIRLSPFPVARVVGVPDNVHRLAEVLGYGDAAPQAYDLRQEPTP